MHNNKLSTTTGRNLRTVFPVPLTLLSLALLFCASCENFLDRQPLDQLTVDSFYRTEADLDRGILSAYSGLQDIEYFGKAWMITEIPSDNSQAGGTDPEFTPIDNFTVNADNPPVANFWASHFRVIALANVMLERTPGSEVSEAKKAAYLAEAKFLRALSYFDLVRIYGEVPLITQVPTLDQDLLLPRASVADIYELMVADLEAGDALPATRSGSAAGRATSGAAKALLAKVELTRRNFRRAADLAREVIASGTYELMPDYGDLWEVGTADNNRETIFQIQYTGCAPFGTGNPLQAFFAPFGQGITKDRDGWGSQIPTGPSLNSPGTTILNAFEPNDERKFHTLMTAGNFYPTINPEDGGYRYPSQGVSAVNANIKKYVIGSGTNVCFMSTPQNGNVIRYADVLLTLAEAAVELDGGVSVNADVLAAFNAVRGRAGLPPVTTVTREGVLRERRVEFAFEGQRWFDLLRSGRAIEILSLHGKNPDVHHLLFPLPSAELEINTNLTQNPGY